MMKRGRFWGENKRKSLMGRGRERGGGGEGRGREIMGRKIVFLISYAVLVKIVCIN